MKQTLPHPPVSGDLLKFYARKILTSRVYDIAVETPLQGARQLSERLGNQVLLKREASTRARSTRSSCRWAAAG